MSDNQEHPPHILNHMHDLGLSPSGSGQTSPEGLPSSEGSSSGRFEFLKFGLGSRKKDGEKPKRRGPKPDSKPAQTRRQELNRQAQRTHRERKEQYTKALEEQVNQLQVDFTRILQERTKALENNRLLLEETNRLKALLDAHGIPYSTQNGFPPGTQRQDPSFTPPPEVARFGQTYNEIGIDFVLALEKPCMDHIQMMLGNIAKNPEADIHGHRLMMSCPPEPTYVNQHAEVPWGVQTWDLAANELSELFNMQNRFGLDGELTPIAVWATISQNPNFSSLDLHDFKSLADELVTKVKCHGFGAVLEEFEVGNSLSSLFSKKQGLAGF